MSNICNSGNIGQHRIAFCTGLTRKVAQLTKQELRKRTLDLIKHQKEEDSFHKSRVICNKLLELPVFRSAKTVMFYISFQGEVNTFPMIAEAFRLNKCVAVPLIRKETRQLIPVVIEAVHDLVPGSYGIPEPARNAPRLQPEDLDLVVVPGVAFDAAGNRLGRGAGYYDRFLSLLPSTTPVIGVGYDFQLTPAIPGLEPHDRRVTTVLTA